MSPFTEAGEAAHRRYQEWRLAELINSARKGLTGLSAVGLDRETFADLEERLVRIDRDLWAWRPSGRGANYGAKDGLLMRDTTVMQWFAQAEQLRNGEVIDDPLPPPPVQVGMTVCSATRRAPGGDYELNGVVYHLEVDADEDRTLLVCRIVTHRYGRVGYDRIEADDIDYSPGAFSGAILRPVIADRVRALHADAARNKWANHMAALAALTTVLEARR